MRIQLPVLTALALVLAAPAALAEATPHTVSDYANVMEAAAVRLDASVTERQKAGDMAAAQRLVLLSAMVRRAGQEFRGAEQEAMTDDVATLPAPAPQRLAAAVEAAGAATERFDDPVFLDGAQRTFNALMAALPMKPRHPIFYGVLSRDVAAKPLAADLVIYGYRILDPVLKIAPTVAIQRSEVTSFTVKDDRIELTLPPDIKTALDFSPSPCESRAGFGLRLVGVYAQPRGVWPISWNNELRTSADLFVLPSPVFYTAKVLARVEQLTQKTTTAPFEARSGLVVADCGQTRTAEVDVPLPPGVTNVTCSGEWVDASGAETSAGRCVNEGGRLRITGELVGGQKVCSPDKLCTCPNSAQGFLRASGSYQSQSAGESVKSETEATPLTFAAGSLAEGTLDIGAVGTLRHLTLSFTRRGCPAEVDALGLNIGAPQEKAEAVSKTGAFRAIFQSGKLTVGAIDAYPTALDKAP